MAEEQGLREHPGRLMRRKQKPEAMENVEGIIALTSEPSIGIEAGIDETSAGTGAGMSMQQQQEAAAGVIRAGVVGPGAEAEKGREPPIVRAGAADPQQMLEGEGQ